MSSSPRPAADFSSPTPNPLVPKLLALPVPASKDLSTELQTFVELQLEEGRQEEVRQFEAARARARHRLALLEHLPEFDLRSNIVNKQHGLAHAFWNELGAPQRFKVCSALYVIMHIGFSNTTCRELKTGLYMQGVLNRNLWNCLLVLLGRHAPRQLLEIFRQSVPLALAEHNTPPETGTL